MELQGTGEVGFAHNWISIYVPACGSSESDRIHLDPWVNNRLAAFTTAEHYAEGYVRSYTGNTGLLLGYFEGYLKGYYDNGTFNSIYPPAWIEDVYWPTKPSANGIKPRWPQWVIKMFP